MQRRNFFARILLFGAVIWAPAAQAEKLPIFDAHIHYSHDAVLQTPPEEVARILREAGVKKALVSSSDDDGTQKLLVAAPEIVVPALRPYRRRGAISTWMHDPSVVDYLKERLAKYEYEAIGEFHAYGDDILTPVIQQMIEMARQRNLILHHHGDREALDLIFKTWPDARVLWAHSGFARPDAIADALKTHPRLWSDLAFRSDMASREVLNRDWEKLFTAYPDRFMVGTDTFAPERWYYVGSHAEYSRGWLASLPDDVARNIAYRNAETMLQSK
ncbi:MAG: amidohydrolase family protein [Rhizobiaceae bacterium]